MRVWVSKVEDHLKGYMRKVAKTQADFDCFVLTEKRSNDKVIWRQVIDRSGNIDIEDINVVFVWDEEPL